MARSQRPNTKTGKTGREAFLSALRELPVVSHAARKAHVSRQTAYAWRDADEAFALQWDEAIDEGIERAEKIAWERGTRTMGPSDVLLIFMLKAHRPEKYRERVDVNQRDLTLEQLIRDAAGNHGDATDATAPAADGAAAE